MEAFKFLALIFVIIAFFPVVCFASVFGNLSVSLDWPTATLNVVQNQTFQINATVTCSSSDENAVCGNITGTARYNLSSVLPDTSVNTTDSDKPLFTLSGNSQSCGDMNQSDSCKLSWLVNTTGDIGSSFLIDVIFESNETEVASNATYNKKINIMDCFVDVTLEFDYILFSDGSHEVWPNSFGNPALGNDDLVYNISVNSGSCDVDFYIKATDMENQTLAASIGVANLTFNNETNDYQSSMRYSKSYQMLRSVVEAGTRFTTWFWMDLPAVYAGAYNGTIYIANVLSGQSLE